jgi:hypothetical protein
MHPTIPCFILAADKLIPPFRDKKRLKKCNLCREQVVLILREMENNYIIIYLKHSNIITNEKKRVWTEIAEQTS